MFPENIIRLVTQFGLLPVLTLTITLEPNVLHRMDISISYFSELSVSRIVYPWNNFFISELSSYPFTYSSGSRCNKTTTLHLSKTRPTVLMWVVNNEEEFDLFLPQILEYIGMYKPNIEQSVYHFLLCHKALETNETFKKLITGIGSILEHPQEFFHCFLSPSPNNDLQCESCYEIYLMKSKAISQKLQFQKGCNNIELIFHLAISEMSLRRTNFLQEAIAAVSLDMPGLVGKRFKPRLKPDDPLEYDGGFNVEKYRFLKDALNFKEKALVTDKILPINADGTLNNSGLAFSLNSGAADITLGEYEFIQYRTSGPYGVRYLIAGISLSKGLVVFVQPSNSGVRYIYRQPFNTSVWLAIILTVLVLLNVFRVLFSHDVHKGEQYFFKRRNAFGQASWIMVQILTLKGNSGINIPSDTLSVKLILFSAFMFSLIMNGMYVSNLTSILTVNVAPVKDFRQLIKFGYSFLVNKYSPMLKQVVEELADKDSLEVTMEEVFPKLYSSRTAILTSSNEFQTILPNYSEDYLCDTLTLLQLSIVPIKEAHVVRRGSPFRNTFNIKLLLMYQSGIKSKLSKDYSQETRLTCPIQNSHKFHSMNLLYVFSPFVIFLMLSSVSMFICVMEVNENRVRAKFQCLKSLW